MIITVTLLPTKKGILFSEAAPWKEQRRFCLHTLRDFGFGKTSMESLVNDELTEFIVNLRPSGVERDSPFVAELDERIVAVVVNVMWLMLAGT